MDCLSIFIPTFNEEIHIERALKSAFNLTKNVFVIDSYSTDRTVEIAERMGAKVYQYKWEADSNWAKNLIGHLTMFHSLLHGLCVMTQMNI